jgi:16S rRNA (cytosine967-C5)-methyltransferase
MSADRTPGAERSPAAGTGRVRVLGEAARELEEALAARQPADAWLSTWFRARPACGSRDRRFLSDTLFSCLRWRGWIGTVREHGPLALFAAYQLQAREPSALADALATAAGVPAESLPPLAARSLSDKARAMARLFGGEPLPIARLVPDWVPSRLAVPAGEQADRFFERCVESFQERPPLWLLALDGSGADLAVRLQAQGQAAEAETRLPGAVRVDGRPHLPELERALGPRFEAQDLASQCVTAACAPEPGGTWWDVCAGGGGKALGLAARMARRGRVWATDIRTPALAELRRRAKRAGFQGIRMRLQSGLDPAPGGEPMDGVLVDAPCSGLGTWSRSPDARWRSEPGEIGAHTELQGRLLDAASRAVRPCGRLVYSVCTLTRAETTDRASAFGASHPEFEPEPFAHPLGLGGAAASHWILPWQGPCGGMFIARWRRAGQGALRRRAESRGSPRDPRL